MFLFGENGINLISINFKLKIYSNNHGTAFPEFPYLLLDIHYCFLYTDYLTFHILQIVQATVMQINAYHYKKMIILKLFIICISFPLTTAAQICVACCCVFVQINNHAARGRSNIQLNWCMPDVHSNVFSTVKHVLNVFCLNKFALVLLNTVALSNNWYFLLMMKDHATKHYQFTY